MARTTDIGGRRINPWRIIGWGGAAALLMVPLVAMQFTSEVDWDETDFIVMGALMGSVGLGIEFLVRMSPNIAYRLGSILAMFASFLLVWINLAVGMIGSEDNPQNLMFAGVLGIALAGAALTGFRASGMAGSMFVAGIAQALAGGIGLFTDMRGGIFSAVFAALWLLSAALFAKAARDEAEAKAG